MKSILAAVAAGLIVTASSASAAPHHYPVPGWMNRPCRTEDSVNCFWDATAHGNGRGRSFYVRQFPHATCFLFVSASGADHCQRND